jgi:hypothetical protein
MAGIFILSMYFQAFMKTKNKEFKIKVVLNPKPLVVEIYTKTTDCSNAKR